MMQTMKERSHFDVTPSVQTNTDHYIRQLILHAVQKNNITYTHVWMNVCQLIFIWPKHARNRDHISFFLFLSLTHKFKHRTKNEYSCEMNELTKLQKKP